MPRKSIQTASQRSTASRLFGTGKGKTPGHIMTSETIAADIAAFKKRGGRIEVLGDTPLRARTQATTFRSRKPRPAAGNTAARD